MGHRVDQDAFQDTEQLWSVFLEVTPQGTELLLTDTQHTATVKVTVDINRHSIPRLHYETVR